MAQRGFDVDSGTIKSIQRGSTTMESVSSLNITISSVDITKSIVRVTISAANTTTSWNAVSAKITSATNIQLNRQVSWATTPRVYWEVIEFNSVASIQSGAYTQAHSTNIDEVRDVTISSVNTSKSLIFFSNQYTVANNEWGYNTLGAFFNSATVLRFTIRGQGQTIYMEWQVIEFN